MSSSMTGATGTPRASTGSSRMRGVNPGQKHIPGHHRFQQFTPEAMELYQRLFENLGPESYLSRLAGGDESLFAEMEAPALQQFSGLQGGLASRFSGMGMGARRSSGFQNTMNKASQDFAMGLQSRRQELQRDALKDMMSYSQMLFGQEPYGLTEKQNKPSFMDKWFELAGRTMGAAGRAQGGI